MKSIESYFLIKEPEIPDINLKIKTSSRKFWIDIFSKKEIFSSLQY